MNDTHSRPATQVNCLEIRACRDHDEPALIDLWTRRGLGRRLMAEVEARIAARGCPKINLQVRAGNRHVLVFYAALGYAEDDIIGMGKRLVRDDG